MTAHSARASIVAPPASMRPDAPSLRNICVHCAAQNVAARIAGQPARTRLARTTGRRSTRTLAGLLHRVAGTSLGAFAVEIGPRMAVDRRRADVGMGGLVRGWA